MPKGIPRSKAAPVDVMALVRQINPASIDARLEELKRESALLRSLRKAVGKAPRARKGGEDA
jgi:hypothetical protein